MNRVLHVGCGHKTLRHMPSYFQDGTWEEVRFDIDEGVAPDIVGTLTDMGSVETGSMQAVFSSHNIEHLFPHEVPIALAEARRVLAPSGFLLVTCPDLKSVSRLIVEDKLNDPAYQSSMGPICPIDIVYGHRASVAKGNHYMAHRGGFTLKTLSNAIREAGFSGVAGSERPNQFALWALGVISKSSDRDLLKLATALFPR